MDKHLVSTRKVADDEKLEEIEVPDDLLPGLYSISAMRRESVQDTVQHAFDAFFGLAPDQLDKRVQELKAEHGND